MGGYVKIACLITVDMDRMAQLRLRENIQFKSVTIPEARSALQDSLQRVSESNIEAE
jgi:allophanate hydrolase subunit 2